MTRILFSTLAAALIAMPMAVVSPPAQAKTATQLKQEKKGAAAKAKSHAKSQARRKK